MLKKPKFRHGFLVLALAAGSVGGFTLASTALATEPDMDVVRQVDLSAFSKAYQQVEGVRQEYLPAAERAESTRDRTRLLQEAHERMRAAIEAEGLTVEQYSHTSLAVSRDPELKSRVVELIRNQES